VALVLLGLSAGGVSARVLGWRPLAALGEAGFAVYVLQYPVHGAARWWAGRAGVDPGTGAFFAAFALATVLAAVAVTRLLEAPARRVLAPALARLLGPAEPAAELASRPAGA
jgi:peptidoglycan/LPS O-acetylase OafA/YrhL